METPLVEQLAPYGAPRDSVIDLRGDAIPDQVRYADLRSVWRRQLPSLPSPHGIVEIQDGPLAYVVEAMADQTSDQLIRDLRLHLSHRGEAPYLVVVEPGRLKVFEVRTPQGRQQEPSVSEFRESPSAAWTFHRLHSEPPVEQRTAKPVQQQLFNLFTKAVEGLAEGFGGDNALSKDSDRISPSLSDAISLAGRALFTRFLVDRAVITIKDLPRICPGAGRLRDVFSDQQTTMTTCRWLDKTFNGDFLPFTGNFRNLDDEAFWHLNNIMHRSPGGQMRFSWATIDFSYIPIEVLSQVYEWSSAKWDLSLKKKQSMYFTPLRIARYMVREVFAGLEASGPVPPHAARVLDPAVGAGVFLVAAFREIFAAHWRYADRPPKTARIRSILEKQLCGFDVHEPALRLAALGLYLTAIELDPDPRLGSLRFSPLQGRSLINVRGEDESENRLSLGSLAFVDNPAHRSRYHVVIGNPPWTSLAETGKDKDHAEQIHASMVEAVRPVVTKRLGKKRGQAFQIPDLVPDLPFVWAAAKWACTNGWISFALHGRVLFKQSKLGRAARQDLLKAMDVTGILNGADVRNENIWPNVAAPFCIVFSKNRKPGKHAAFTYVNPRVETSLNRQGRIRVDVKDSHPVATSSAVEKPELLKALFRGTGLDFDILGRIQRASSEGLEEYWLRTCNRKGAQGYQKKGQKNSASHLKGYPNLDRAVDSVLISQETTTLERFSRRYLHRPRCSPKRPGSCDIYRGPLLLVRKSEPTDKHAARAHVYLEDQLVYNESHYGYSAFGSNAFGDSAFGDNGEEALVRYMSILLNSDLFLWHTLVTSGEFGVERDSFQKEDVDMFPIVPLQHLFNSNSDVVGEIKNLSDRLFKENRSENVVRSMNDFCAAIYDLDQWDLEVIQDTLATFSPLKAADAEGSPKRQQTEAFVKRLRRELAPFFEPAKLKISFCPIGPWGVISAGSPNTAPSRRVTVENLLAKADDLGASQVSFGDAENHQLVIAILMQYRYWTPTRARILAMEILEGQYGSALDDI